MERAQSAPNSLPTDTAGSVVARRQFSFVIWRAPYVVASTTRSRNAAKLRDRLRFGSSLAEIIRAASSLTSREIPVFLQNTLERLPSSPFDGIPKASLLRYVGRYSRISIAHCIPVAKVPRLKLLDDNAKRYLPRAIGNLGPSTQIRRGCFQLSLQNSAIIIVAIGHNDNTPIVGKPISISAQYFRYIPQQFRFTAKYMDLERAIPRNKSWKKSA